MDYDDLSSIEKIELYKLAEMQRTKYVKSENTYADFKTLDEYMAEIVRYAKIIAKLL